MIGKTKPLFAIAALGGFALAAGLVLYNDANAVLAAVTSQGVGLLAIIAFHFLPLAVSGSAWQLLVRPDWKGSFVVFVWARILREAVNDLFPVAQIGGLLAGGRTLTLKGAPGISTAGGLIADQTAETISQCVFALLGFAIFVSRVSSPLHYTGIAEILLVAVLALIAFVAAQRAGLIRLAERLMAPLLERSGVEYYTAGDVHDAVWRIYERRWSLATSFALHLICWCIGTGEVWLALKFLGHEVSVPTAFVLESLGQAIRSAAFMIPAALGVQEGGFLLLGAALGLSPQLGLALSLTKRVREIAIGGTALLVWQIFEGKRLARAMGSSPPSSLS